MNQDFRDAVASIIDQYMRDNIHTSAPAKVGNVSENFTAELTPDLKVTTDDDREVPYPKISGTVILMPTGAGGTIGFAFPVHSGDEHYEHRYRLHRDPDDVGSGCCGNSFRLQSPSD